MRPAISQILCFALLTSVASPALALGPSLGVRVGGGTVLWQDAHDEPEATVFAVGPAARFDLGVLTFEADLLWNQTSWQSQGEQAQLQRIAVPLLAKVNIELVPSLAYFSFGAGIEPRWRVGAKIGDEDVSGIFAKKTMYVPVVAGLDLDLKLVQLNAEVRYSHQIEPELVSGSTRAHQVMGMLGVFF